jgi:hypothetical protein
MSEKTQKYVKEPVTALLTRAASSKGNNMKSSQLHDFIRGHKAQGGDETAWRVNNILKIDITQVRTNPDRAQVRQDGTDSNHVEQLCHSIQTHDQKVPITVEIVGKDVDGRTIYEIVDGNHRYASIKKLGTDNPNERRWDHIDVFVRNFVNDFDRLQYQTKANAHDTPAKVSSIHDAVTSLARIIAYGLEGKAPEEVEKIYHSAVRNLTEPAKYEKDLKKAAKILFGGKDGGLNSKQINSVVRNLQGKALPGKFVRYTASTATESFLDWIDEANGGYIDEDYIHTVKNHNYIDWQLIARLFATRSDDQNKNESDKESIVVMYWSDIAGKTNINIDKHRRKMLKLINQRNNSWLLKSFRRQRVKLVDRIFIAPQKRDPGCQENGFWEVEKNSKGEFSLTMLPTMGWDTIPEAEDDAEAAK